MFILELTLNKIFVLSCLKDISAIAVGNPLAAKKQCFAHNTVAVS